MKLQVCGVAGRGKRAAPAGPGAARSAGKGQDRYCKWEWTGAAKVEDWTGPNVPGIATPAQLHQQPQRKRKPASTAALPCAHASAVVQGSANACLPAPAKARQLTSLTSARCTSRPSTSHKFCPVLHRSLPRLSKPLSPVRREAQEPGRAQQGPSSTCGGEQKGAAGHVEKGRRPSGGPQKGAGAQEPGRAQHGPSSTC